MLRLTISKSRSVGCFLNYPLLVLCRHLEEKYKHLNAQRDQKKKDAQKKFNDMKVKWKENERLVSFLSSLCR